MKNEKIPIIVGVTGHRNIVGEDKAEIKAKVVDSLKEIQNLCKGKDGNDTPVIMLNAFAQGADMLCAEAAFELGIDVYAVLPRDEKKYIDSFDDEADRAKLFEYLSKAKRKFVAPDMEKNKAWLKKTIYIDDDSYEYRQLGIYMAEHSHILIALWDGKPPKTQFGCGTVEVIKFALEHNFLDKDHLFKPGAINNSAVVWIKSRRQGDGDSADIQKQWLISSLDSCGKDSSEYLTSTEPPEFLKDIISKTARYNADTVSVGDDAVNLWANVDELDEYRKNVRYHYAKANELSYGKNQKKYNLFLLLIAIIGTVIAFTFLIYDDAGLPYMIFPCTLALGAILWLCYYGRKKKYHADYIEYRALAEALRIQFYTSMCLGEKEIVTDVCDLYSWSQKMDLVWIDKAIRALSVINSTDKLSVTPSAVMEVWIGKSEKPMGQLRYHSGKLGVNKKQAKKYESFSKVFRCATVAIYFIIFAFEVAACIMKAAGVDWFYVNDIFGNISWRSFCAIVLGVFTAGSLLFSSYWGRLSFDRKLDDNIKMCEYYASAYARWNEVKAHPNGEIEKFVREIAREEIVENGVWYSYVKENGLDITI
ncbi:MAG: hypothetical protein HDT28_08090 [Clostridiales bacterium]|nr:hypothetical protein [Clostridiales bacterium]